MSLKISYNEISYRILSEQKYKREREKERDNTYIYLTPRTNPKINRLSPFKPSKHKMIKEINQKDTIKGVNLLYIFESL